MLYLPPPAKSLTNLSEFAWGLNVFLFEKLYFQPYFFSESFIFIMWNIKANDLNCI